MSYRKQYIPFSTTLQLLKKNEPMPCLPSVTIHGALHPAARHPANKATVSGIQPLAEGDFSWVGCVTVREPMSFS